MKRSSSSIPTNIAEGCGRNSEKIFAVFIYCIWFCELEYQLLLSIDLKFIDNESGQKLLFQVEEKC
jgi:four helix bundle protein